MELENGPELIDLTNNCDNDSPKKYYFVVFWDKKPFWFMSAFIADSIDVLKKELPEDRIIGDCTVEDYAEGLYDAINAQMSSDPHYVMWEEKWNGLYVCTYNCSKPELQNKMNETITHIDNTYNYDKNDDNRFQLSY
jgi:hypothetical protein